MFPLAELPVDPNVIIVFAMVIFAGIKALLEKIQGTNSVPPSLEEEEDFSDPYAEYEAELERQRAELEIPPPITEAQAQTPPPSLPLEPRPTVSPSAPSPSLSSPTFGSPLKGAGVSPASRPSGPKLSPAEKAALENLKLIPLSKRRSSTSTKARVKRHLASPTAAREALLLAEILGPPKALKADDQL